MPAVTYKTDKNAMNDLLMFGVCAIDDRGRRIDIRTLRIGVNAPANALPPVDEWRSL